MIVPNAGSASAPFTTGGYYRSTEETATRSDVLADAFEVGELPAGQSMPPSDTLPIPDPEAGPVYYAACVETGARRVGYGRQLLNGGEGRTGPAQKLARSTPARYDPADGNPRTQTS